MKVVRVVLDEEPIARDLTPRRLWDNYKVIGEVRKNNKTKFVVSAGIRDGVKYIGIREFYFRVTNGDWRPGRHGITIPLKVPVDNATQIIEPYKELVKLIQQTVEELGTMELCDEEHSVTIMR